MTKYFNNDIDKIASRRSIIDAMRCSMDITRRTSEPIKEVVKATAKTTAKSTNPKKASKAKRVAKALGLVGTGVLLGTGLDSD